MHNLKDKNIFQWGKYQAVYMPEHPNASSNGCVLLHRMIMENKIQRLLLKTEHVHHIDNNPLNNKEDNLELLNHRTHAYKTFQHQPLENIECKYCFKNFKPKGKKIKFCSTKCWGMFNRKVKRPTKKELQKMIWENPSTKIAKQFGVSDRMVKKWCDNYGIKKPPRGYWQKLYAKKYRDKYQ